MLGKVKDWLGIEGVKMDIVLPEFISRLSGRLPGKLMFSTIREQRVERIELKLIERYSRGRRKNKLIDEYILGEIVLEEDFLISADEVKEFEFELPFDLDESVMDRFERNILLRGPVFLAKKLRGVKSSFRLEAKLKVEDVKLPPVIKKEVIMK
jgi:hypothetical protein